MSENSQQNNYCLVPVEPQHPHVISTPYSVNEFSNIRHQGIFTSQGQEVVVLNARPYSEWHILAVQDCARDYDFHFLGKIGEGGFGNVYKVESKCTGEIFAVKRMEKKKGNSAAIFSENQSLLKTENKYIIKLFSCFQTVKHVNFVLEYAQYGDLHGFLKKGPVPEKIKAAFLIMLAEGVSHLQSVNIVHGDIKPTNVLVCANLQLKIADFGTSKKCTKDEVYQGEYGSTMAYRAPESVMDSCYSHQSDVWSLGVTIFEIYSSCNQKLFQTEQDDDNYEGIIQDQTYIDKTLSQNIRNEKVLGLLKNLLVQKKKYRLKVDDIFKKHRNIWTSHGLNRDTLNSENLMSYVKPEQLEGKNLRIESKMEFSFIKTIDEVSFSHLMYYACSYIVEPKGTCAAIAEEIRLGCTSLDKNELEINNQERENQKMEINENEEMEISEKMNKEQAGNSSKQEILTSNN